MKDFRYIKVISQIKTCLIPILTSNRSVNCYCWAFCIVIWPDQKSDKKCCKFDINYILTKDSSPANVCQRLLWNSRWISLFNYLLFSNICCTSAAGFCQITFHVSNSYYIAYDFLVHFGHIFCTSIFNALVSNFVGVFKLQTCS